MESFLIVLHFFLCLMLIGIILLQSGRGADIGAVFGGASQTMFGSRGPATFLNKITVFVAAGFLVTSIALAHLAKERSGASVIDKAPITETAKPADAAVDTATAVDAGKTDEAQKTADNCEKAPK